MFIIQVNVEDKGQEIYYTGPFHRRKDAERYCEDYHDTLDSFIIIKLNPGLQAHYGEE